MAKTAMDEVDKEGAFVRTESGFRGWVKADGSSEFPVESGRYHLYVSYACPWASRCLAFRVLKGLEEHITFSTVDAVMRKTRPDDPNDEHHGWVFIENEDPLHGRKSIREIYEAEKRQTHKFTVPILYDKKENRIVSNESSEIIRMFNSEFQALIKDPVQRERDFYPEDMREAIDAVNEWVYTDINNGVYKCGFAKKQGAYDAAAVALFSALDRVERTLGKQRYIAGETLSEADIRLFVTIVRFDNVYHTHFKCNKKRIIDYPNLYNYIREIYQTDRIAETVNMHHIVHHYYRSHPTVNPYGIVPLTPSAEEGFKLPHDRDR
eukprot:CAMPEP_0203754380 /NCGR_PEP_ID=MMETSP0098-20131031/7981_1 /ASSEMBLY_ACC=CAM_ASM_000208 /TAXON_ID=96639 /ORGANISM=" , Strain NY0313808BC1" /LENGTH=321 /DNA_ID=CAMNT_0050645349 /DNA_START=68 /DNA_END=1030 /DNA_ORIENTATION=-